MNLFAAQNGSTNSYCFEHNVPIAHLTLRSLITAVRLSQGEHSMMDGMPMLRFADYLMRQTMTAAPSASEGAAAQSHPVFVTKPTQISMALSPAALRHIAEAQTAFTKLTEGHECRSLAYSGYGSDAIKSFGMSPDAFVQVSCYCCDNATT